MRRESRSAKLTSHLIAQADNVSALRKALPAQAEACAARAKAPSRPSQGPHEKIPTFVQTAPRSARANAKVCPDRAEVRTRCRQDQLASSPRSTSQRPAWLRRMSLMPFYTEGEFSAWVLMEVCASSAPMMAFISSFLKSGELANCSLVLFAACWRSVSDSSSLPLITLLT